MTQTLVIPCLRKELGSLVVLKHHLLNLVCGFFLPCQCTSSSSEDLMCLVLLGGPRVGGFNGTTTDRHVGKWRGVLAWLAKQKVINHR